VVGPTATDVATASVCTVVGEGSASRMNRADVEQRAAVVVGQRADVGLHCSVHQSLSWPSSSDSDRWSRLLCGRISP
jgi:hypothetical protein